MKNVQDVSENYFFRLLTVGSYDVLACPSSLACEEKRYIFFVEIYPERNITGNTNDENKIFFTL